MEIQVLGGLAVLHGTRKRLGTPKQLTVLAMLAVHPGRLVTVDELVDELWPENPPRSAAPNVRSYAANLRRAFDDIEESRGVLVRQGAGYRLTLEPDRVDLFRFVCECRQARELLATSRPGRAAALLNQAVARWHGLMLADVPLGPVLTARRTAADEERAAAIELLADIRIRAGQSELAIPLLRGQVQAHPLREHAHLLLVRALHQNGDLSGAVTAYRAARDVLLDELGVEPGAEFQRLYQAVLNREPLPEVQAWGPVAAGTGTPPTLVAPRVREQKPVTRAPLNWLPRAVTDFVGREEPVARLLKNVRQVESRTSAVHVIDGMAGSGKSTLAVHLAHLLAERYADAQLFIDLRGHGDGVPLEPAAALVILLRQLGVPAERIPREFDHRVKLWRRELAEHRAVVVLDNAASSEQVRPLVPAGPGTVVLITSRRRLLALDSGPAESLPVLSPDDAVNLLARVAGAERVRSDPEAAAEVVRRCGYLPLAIRLAGARLEHRRNWRVGDLADRLRQDLPALAVLAAEDRTVAGAFAASYDPLPETGRRTFRLLGLFPGEHFGVRVVAALTGMSVTASVEILDDLVDRHLVEEISADRYRLHDLVRQYAAGLVQSDDDESVRQNAVGSLLDHYLHAVATVTVPLETQAPLLLGAPRRPGLLDQDRLDLAWLDGERANLTAVVSWAEKNGHFREAWQLARLLWRFHYNYGYLGDMLDTQLCGLGAAEKAGDDAAVGQMNNYLASAYVRMGAYQRALEHLQRAETIRRRLGDVIEGNTTRMNLCAVYGLLGRLEEALAINKDLLKDVRLTPLQRMGVLTNQGVLLNAVGRHDQALRALRMHLWLARSGQDQFRLVDALNNIAYVRHRLGDHRYAIRLLKAVLAIGRCTTGRYGEGEALSRLGAAHRSLGEWDEALRCHELAIEAASHGPRHLEAASLNELGLTLAVVGQRGRAVEMHKRALELATRISHPYEQGRALACLAEHFLVTDSAEARRHWQRALAIFRKMGVPERFEVERSLAAIANRRTPEPTADRP